MNTVPCPMCCNSQTPGQLDQPRQGWASGQFADHLMSVPCPLCAGVGTFLQEEWDKMSRPQAETKKKKSEQAETIGPSIFGGMKAAREQREKDWFDEGPFDISAYRKVD